MFSVLISLLSQSLQIHKMSSQSKRSIKEIISSCVLHLIRLGHVLELLSGYRLGCGYLLILLCHYCACSHSSSILVQHFTHILCLSLNNFEESPWRNFKAKIRNCMDNWITNRNDLSFQSHLLFWIFWKLFKWCLLLNLELLHCELGLNVEISIRNWRFCV